MMGVTRLEIIKLFKILTKKKKLEILLKVQQIKERGIYTGLLMLNVQIKSRKTINLQKKLLK